MQRAALLLQRRRCVGRAAQPLLLVATLQQMLVLWRHQKPARAASRCALVTASPAPGAGVIPVGLVLLSTSVTAPFLQVPSAKEAAATMQLRPVGVSKIDLASSFVDAVSPTGSSATCSTAQQLTQAADIAMAGNAAAPATNAAAADQAPRMSRNPLGALNTRQDGALHGTQLNIRECTHQGSCFSPKNKQQCHGLLQGAERRWQAQCGQSKQSCQDGHSKGPHSPAWGRSCRCPAPQAQSSGAHQHELLFSCKQSHGACQRPIWRGTEAQAAPVENNLRVSTLLHSDLTCMKNSCVVSETIFYRLDQILSSEVVLAMALYTRVAGRGTNCFVISLMAS